MDRKLKMMFSLKGVTLKPTYIFCLDAKKYAKKVKTVVTERSGSAPASLEKAARERLKSSKLSSLKARRTETIFNRLSHLFFGSSDDVAFVEEFYQHLAATPP